MKWISVKDHNPKGGVKVLCYINSLGGFYKVMACWQGMWEDYHSLVTHWMPLPEPPK